ncbi:MAG: hypothetical protein ACRDRY_19895 [Pseudonocardiaceae bacterium]
MSVHTDAALAPPGRSRSAWPRGVYAWTLVQVLVGQVLSIPAHRTSTEQTVIMPI